MKLLLMIPTLFLLCQGCVAPPPAKQEAEVVDIQKEQQQKQQQQEAKASEQYLYYYVANSSQEISDLEKQEGVMADGKGYGRLYSFNGEKSLILSEVVSKMADQLLNNYGAQYHNESIALTSLVDLNDHKHTNWLGQTIAEQFIHELHIRQLRVVDFKLTGNIQVTEKGEFAITRDWKKLNKDVNVTRILAGTMSRNEEGVILNIRIVNAANSVVESTSSAFIPHSMFVGGQYDYQPKRYISRNSQRRNNESLVRLVR